MLLRSSLESFVVKGNFDQQDYRAFINFINTVRVVQLVQFVGHIEKSSL